MFFSLVKDKNIGELSIREQDIRFCDDIRILKWLFDHKYPMGDTETYRSILGKAVENNDNNLFYEVYAMLKSTSGEYPLKEEPTYRDIVDQIFAQDNLELFKFLQNEGLTYKDEYLERAIKEGRKDFIRYFIVDMGVEWTIPGRYETIFAPDLSKDYDTWEYSVKLIEASL